MAEQPSKLAQLATAFADAQKALLGLPRDATPEQRKAAQQHLAKTGKALADFRKSDAFKNSQTRKAVDKGIDEANERKA